MPLTIKLRTYNSVALHKLTLYAMWLIHLTETTQSRLYIHIIWQICRYILSKSITTHDTNRHLNFERAQMHTKLLHIRDAEQNDPQVACHIIDTKSPTPLKSTFRNFIVFSCHEYVLDDEDDLVELHLIRQGISYARLNSSVYGMEN